MTKDEIIDMAVTANLCPDRVNTRQANWITNTEELLHFAALVAQAEREACAAAAEKQARWIGYNVHAQAIADAIRARG